MPRELLIKDGNFYRDEFECHGKNCCGHSAPVSERLVKALQKLRDLTKNVLHVNCGFRCVTHNARTDNASPNSYHTKGMAADIRSDVFAPQALALLAETIDEFNNGGIGLYEGRIHVDVRTTGKARWGY